MSNIGAKLLFYQEFIVLSFIVFFFLLNSKNSNFENFFIPGNK